MEKQNRSVFKFLEILASDLVPGTQQALSDWTDGSNPRPRSLVCGKGVQDSWHIRLKWVVVTPVGCYCYDLPSLSVFCRLWSADHLYQNSFTEVMVKNADSWNPVLRYSDSVGLGRRGNLSIYRAPLMHLSPLALSIVL